MKNVISQFYFVVLAGLVFAFFFILNSKLVFAVEALNEEGVTEQSATAKESQNKIAQIPSSISLNISADNAGGRGSNLSGELGTFSPLAIQIGAGSTKYQGEDVTEKTSESFYLGTTYNITQEFTFGISGETWGLKDELVVNTGSLLANYKNKIFGIKLKPRSSEIRFRTNTLRAKEIVVQDDSLETKLSLIYFKPFRVTLGYDKHSYDKDMTLLSGDRVALIFSDTTLSLASSLILEKTSLDFSYDFQKFLIGLYFANSKSAFDESISRSAEIYADFYVKENWILGGSLGTSRTGEERDPTTGEEQVPFRYMGLAVTYEFD